MKLVLALFISAVGLSVASAQFSQQGTKLVGTGESGASRLGYSVAISGDGNTVIAGGWEDSSQLGAAWIFFRNGGVWSQQGNKLVGAGSIGRPQQGISVGISADGNTAIIGGPADSSGGGAAWIFVRNGDAWSQQGGKLVGTGAVWSNGLSHSGASQGRSVALSGDGNTAILGGPNDNGGYGAAWVFTRDGNAWYQQGSKLVGTGGVNGQISGTPSEGYSVSLSADGNTAIIGGEGDAGGKGAVWIFTRSGGVWTQVGQKLVPSDEINNPDVGWSVSLSGDGNTAMTGGPYDNFSYQYGASWIYVHTDTGWAQDGSKLFETGYTTDEHQGWSVSLSSDGNTALIGAQGDNGGVGAGYVLSRSGDTWSLVGSKFAGNDAAGAAQQGYSAALSGDAGTAILGGPYDNSDTGAVWVFVRSTSAVNQTAPAVPASFELGQNYPNPFNPTTKIQLTLADRQLTIVNVYDVLGRKVATLLNEVKDPGTYTVEFNATGLASGVYYYRMAAGSFVQTKKLLLLR